MAKPGTAGTLPGKRLPMRPALPAGPARLPILFILATLVFGSSLPGQATRFSEHLILDHYTYAFGVAAADLDGDGDLDLTSSDAFGHDSLYWLENDGSGNFRAAFHRQRRPRTPGAPRPR